MTPRNVPESEPHPPRTSGIVEVVTALSMTVRRGSRARAVADLAEVATGDRVVDIGCGPGAAARLAARRGATVVGVDPSSVMLRFARWISSARRAHGIDWRGGRASALPAGPAVTEDRSNGTFASTPQGMAGRSLES
jgi:SAM-dependent methyltransferase